MMKQGLKALVVDDDDISRTLVVMSLKTLGISSSTAHNGVVAITSLKSMEYDFILMDVRMPEQDGLDAARWVRELEGEYYRTVPIFALTNFESEEHTREIMESGMNEHFVKPINIPLLEKILARYFPA